MLDQIGGYDKMVLSLKGKNQVEWQIGFVSICNPQFEIERGSKDGRTLDAGGKVLNPQSEIPGTYEVGAQSK
ncbi:MAG: hypothetical protein AB1797_13150 [bacterium]